MTVAIIVCVLVLGAVLLGWQLSVVRGVGRDPRMQRGYRPPDDHQ
jgi:hypothetical protein